MKFIPLFSAILFLGCQEQTDIQKQPEKNYDLITTDFNSLFTNSLNNAKQLKFTPVFKDSEGNSKVKIDIPNIYESTEQYLLSNHFEGVGAVNLHLSFIQPYSSTNARIAQVTSMLDTISVFNDTQKELIHSLTVNISSLDDLNKGTQMVTAFNHKVASAQNLSEMEKVQLLEFSSLAASFIEFVDKDGPSAISQSLVNVTEGGASHRNARVSGCSVNWRGVWAGAVIGFVGGAYVGGKAGLIAGTFTVPGIGTATGLVGGAMLGGASGFVGGTISGVAAELLTSCLRNNLVNMDQHCNQLWDQFQSGTLTPEKIPADCWPGINVSDTNIQPTN